jgi:cytochrome c-type biogenesis protein CcmE
VNARAKFLIGGALVLSSAGYLMASSIRSTGTYYLTPSELVTKLSTDPTFYDVGLKMGANVVKGSIERSPGGREVRFRITDGARVIPVHYKGIIPDTFTDAEDIEVVVEGRMARNGTFEATTLLAKCASRYENAPQKGEATSPGGAYPPGAKHPDGVPKGTPPAAPAAPAVGTQS